MRQLILNIIDFFYPPFRKFMPLQTFRYLACGGSNTLFDIVLYSAIFHFVLHEQDVRIWGLTISGPIAANVSMAVTVPTGFLLSKFIVFSESNLQGRVQLFRYLVLVAACIYLNYIFLSLFTKQFHIYPTIAKIMTVAIVVVFSYLTQKKFTFKTKSIPLP